MAADWNGAFQRLLEVPATTAVEARNRTAQIAQLSRRFVAATRRVAAIIVMEELQGLPPRRRAVAPVDKPWGMLPSRPAPEGAHSVWVRACQARLLESEKR